ncbi:MAG: glutathione S-transferase [Methyloprofundus sp.]|nr:glutathione S-transferase [Methyloprofundus sp.]
MLVSDSVLPVLYSFRRCPYAMRARMALKMSGCAVHLREVVLRDKPQALLECSAKGTVPVLVLADGTVIDESRDIMQWALGQSDPELWFPKDNEAMCRVILQLLDMNDGTFKNNLDRYKYPDRYPEQQAEYYRTQGEQFLALLEARLGAHSFLMNDKVSMADIGISPFIRQFANVDRDWFDQASYPKLQAWLEYFIQSELFNAVMEKYSPWDEKAEPIVFF